MPNAESYHYSGRKTVIALASNLEAGVALNVAAHLSIALGAHAEPGLMGRRWLVDGSAVRHAGISRYNVVITKVKQGRLRQLLSEARELPDGDLFLADFPEQMLSTGHDDELASALADVAESDLAYLGVLVHGPADPVKALTGRFMLWR
ncbi:DUF2000 domain-containing protein [Micromonospora tarensis]|uniref:DUF2000 domain-containing protein n=1 Tax=Micromonospora tarensis TaxID=2806100 RepID=A0ABS1YDL2_9ACTN|nr:DUF2000 domain-containing protein [Micromonospora tarensis]MBM0275493.1 DUF2000 domain-containing protein [Micromonospora tarensis]